uniref:Uncharacterized protein n=1 Tax=viral metagenome TaxID=1070528 RepID=A0A6C0CU75_9ZZZZ
MLINASSQSIVLLFLCVVIIEFIYFVGMKNFLGMSQIDVFMIIVFNGLFLFIITSNILDHFKYANLPEKPKSHYIGIGGSMYEYIWGMFYDYKVIVDRHDRDRLVGNPPNEYD